MRTVILFFVVALSLSSLTAQADAVHAPFIWADAVHAPFIWSDAVHAPFIFGDAIHAPFDVSLDA